MNTKLKIYGMIPARIGSSRLKFKNFALIDNKPLIYYAINAAKESGICSKVFINSDDKMFNELAIRYNVDFYLRDKELGSSIAKSDEVVADFISNQPKFDILIWVNSIAPLMCSSHIKETLNYFLENDLDSLITSENKNVHANFLKDPINYKKDEVFAQTQDLEPIELFNYCIMMWKTDSFMNAYKKNDFGLMSGKFKTYPLNDIDVIIKTASDLKLAEKIIISRKDKNIDVSYDKSLNLDHKGESY